MKKITNKLEGIELPYENDVFVTVDVVNHSTHTTNTFEISYRNLNTFTINNPNTLVGNIIFKPITFELPEGQLIDDIKSYFYFIRDLTCSIDYFFNCKTRLYNLFHCFISDIKLITSNSKETYEVTLNFDNVTPLTGDTNG